MSEKVVENTLSRYGLRSVKVMRMGGRVAAWPWMERCVPGEVAEDDLELVRGYDADLDVHYLTLVWHAREVVNLIPSPGFPLKDDVQSVWWYLTVQDGSFRWQADMAATLYFLRLGRWPDTVLVKTAPPGAVDVFEVEGLGEYKQLQLVETGWVPANFLVLVCGDDLDVQALEMSELPAFAG